MCLHEFFCCESCGRWTCREEEAEQEDKDLEFSPEKGNVVFASAHDGWAFTTAQIAAIYAEKLGIRADRLAGVMWGDWALDPKTKRVAKIKRSQLQKLRPLFVQVTTFNTCAVFPALVFSGPTHQQASERYDSSKHSVPAHLTPPRQGWR